MKTFTAGRFRADVFDGVRNGRATTLVELHRNGSREEMGRLSIDFDDLPDLRHVLERAIAAHGAAAVLDWKPGAPIKAANWEQTHGPFCSTCHCGGNWHYQGCEVGKARGDTHFVRKADA